MIRSKITKGILLPTADIIKGTKISKHIKFLEKSQWWSRKKIEEYQNEKIRKLIKHAYENVPYYHKTWGKIGMRPEDIQTINDLKKLPILTKKDVRKHFKDIKSKDFKKRNPKLNATGGSTGEPMKFYYDWDSWSMDWACMYRGWGYAGYKLGDKIVTIGGSSVVPGTKKPITYKLKNKMENHIGLSAFDMNNKNMKTYAKTISEFKPKFLRGYPTSIYIFAEFCKRNDIKFPSIKAIFTTAETLLQPQRKKIESVFGVKVFDTYGARDGGANAFECKKHTGMHISAEKAVVEFVKDMSLPSNMKKIILTDLTNYAFPFIRYDVGDFGIKENKKCSCGRNLPQIKKIIGRTTDIIRFEDGTAWGGPALTLVFKYFDVLQYQIIQNKKNEITIKLIKGKTFTNKDHDKLIKIFKHHAGKNSKIKIKYVKSIPASRSGKVNFIISKVKS